MAGGVRNRFAVEKLASGPMWYIRDRGADSLLCRPAREGGFVRFQFRLDAEEYVDKLNNGKVSPPAPS